MPPIKVRVDFVKALSNNINQNTANIGNVKSGIWSLRRNVDSRILARRNIDSRMTSLYNSLNSLENQMRSLNTFNNNSIDKYCLAENRLNNLALSVGARSKGPAGGIDSLHNSGLEKRPGKVNKLSDNIDKVTKGIDLAGNGAELAQTLFLIKSALGSKFKIVVKGDYYIIKGSPKFRIEEAKILGTRYKIGSPKANAHVAKYVNPDLSAKAIAKNVGTNIKGCLGGTFKDAYVFQKGDLLGNIGRGMGYASVALGVGNGIIKNKHAGETEVTKYAADATVDLAKGLGSMAVATGAAKVGAAIGTAIPIPVVGTVVGAAAGFAVGFIAIKLYDAVLDKVEIKGKSISDHAKSGVKYGLDKVASVGSNIYNGAANISKDVGQAINHKLSTAKNNVRGLLMKPAY
jgi:hypothetical protein